MLPQPRKFWLCRTASDWMLKDAQSYPERLPLLDFCPISGLQMVRYLIQRVKHLCLIVRLNLPLDAAPPIETDANEMVARVTF
jgi:hypothetical protein